MANTYNTRIRYRKDTDANWTSANPVLLKNERIIVETEVSGNTVLRTKTGDGVKTYTVLPFDDEWLKTSADDALGIAASAREIASAAGEQASEAAQRLNLAAASVQEQISQLSSADSTLQQNINAVDTKVGKLENVVKGKLTETITFSNKIDSSGMSLPDEVLPTAKINRVGGITEATCTTNSNGMRTWTDTPADIMKIISRGRNLGLVVRNFRQTPGFIYAKQADPTSSSTSNCKIEATLTENGSLHLYLHGVEFTPLEGTKITIELSIYDIPVLYADMEKAFIDAPAVINNDSNSCKVIADAKNYVYIYDPITNNTDFTINSCYAKVADSKRNYIGNITSHGFIGNLDRYPYSGTRWDIYSWICELTCNTTYGTLDITVPMGVFRFDPTSIMSSAQAATFDPKTDYGTYSLLSDYYRPYECSILELPRDDAHPLHGFNKNYANWLTFNDTGVVTYTDNYKKYICDATKYSYNHFDDATVEIPVSEAGWAGMTPMPFITWEHTYPTGMTLHSDLSESDMTSSLQANQELFASRTKSIANGESVSQTKVVSDFSPYITIYGGGTIQFLDSKSNPVAGILDITYQKKITDI